MNSKIIDKFKDNKVVIIGDVMLDKYLSGKIERISPEAPVPIVSLQEREARLGGAANVALSIKALEAEALLFSIIGDDENGRTLTKLVSERQISTKHLVISPYRKTTVKSRILASNQQILRVDEEDTHPLHQDVESKLYADLAAFIANNEVAVIIFQDYNKGVLSPKLIQQIILLANSKHIPTVVDPKKANFWAYVGVTCFKPNLKEIKEALLLDIQPTGDSLKEVHKALHNQLKNEISLVTLSEHGIYFGTKEVSHLVPTKPRKIVDVCGAGDAVVAIVALCIAHQVNPLIICKLANMAGGQVCESVGVVPVEKVNLCRELSNDTLK
jgi:rfaE bifunctional protein kinase chain/domain